MASDRSAIEDNKVTESKIEIRLNDFSTDLRELPTAIVNRLERERWSNLQTLPRGLPTHLKHVTMVSGVTWEVIPVLVIDKRHGEPTVLDAVAWGDAPALPRYVLRSLQRRSRGRCSNR